MLRGMLRPMARRFKAELPEQVKAKIRSLSMDNLERLTDAWEDMGRLDELESWLSSI